MPPDEVMLIIADIIACVAAQLDLNGQNCPLNDRLDVLIVRVRERYPEVLNDMVHTRTLQRSVH